MITRILRSSKRASRDQKLRLFLQLGCACPRPSVAPREVWPTLPNRHGLRKLLAISIRQCLCKRIVSLCHKNHPPVLNVTCNLSDSFSTIYILILTCRLGDSKSGWESKWINPIPENGSFLDPIARCTWCSASSWSSTMCTWRAIAKWRMRTTVTQNGNVYFTIHIVWFRFHQWLFIEWKCVVGD